MEKQTAVAIAAKYFKIHKVNQLFITSDKQAFYNKHEAENHAKGLKEKEVIAVKRIETIVADDSLVKAKAAKEKAEKEAADMAAADKQ